MSIARLFTLAQARGGGGNLEIRIQERSCGDATHKWNARLVRLDAQHNQDIEQQSGETPERAIANVETVLERLLTRDAEGLEERAAKARATLTGSDPSGGDRDR